MCKKLEDVENLGMEMELEATVKVELKVAEGELTDNCETLSKFKKDVQKFLVTTNKFDMSTVDPPAYISIPH